MFSLIPPVLRRVPAMPIPEAFLDKVYSVYSYRGREFLRYAWERITGNNIVLVEAPTGYGKTTLSQAYSLYSIREGFKQIVAYPLRSLLEDQHVKFRDLAWRLGLGDIVGSRYMHHMESHFYVKPITLTTVDTLSMTMFGLEPRDLDKALRNHYGSISGTVGHYLFARSTVLLSNIVLDEVHLLADTSKSLDFLASLVVLARQNGVGLLFMSATLPEAFVNSLKDVDRGIEVVRFREDIDPGFVEEREAKEIDYEPPERICGEEKYEWIAEQLLQARENLGGEGLRAIIVFNTVREAMEMYDYLKERRLHKEYPVYLIHSRYREKDRRRIVGEIVGKAGILRDRLAGNNAPHISYIVVATQVIEAGIDISANTFITDIAPANSLIQRLGRFLRYPGEKCGVLRIWYEKNFETGRGHYKVYDKHLVQRTMQWLRSARRFNPHLPRHYKGLLDNVYTTADFRVRASQVQRLVTLTLTLRSPEEAVKLFLELGGSYIRESVMIPVIPEKDLGRGVTEPIPCPARGLKPSMVKCKLVREAGAEKCVAPKPYELRRDKLFRLSLEPGFIGLVVRADYDPEKGLIMQEKPG